MTRRVIHDDKHLLRDGASARLAPRITDQPDTLRRLVKKGLADQSERKIGGDTTNPVT